MSQQQQSTTSHTTHHSAGNIIRQHGKYVYKTYFILLLLGVALIKLTSFPNNNAIDLFAITTSKINNNDNIPCNNNNNFTSTSRNTIMKNTFQNDPNPNEPWPRIAWLMTYPNSVRYVYVTFFRHIYTTCHFPAVCYQASQSATV